MKYALWLLVIALSLICSASWCDLPQAPVVIVDVSNAAPAEIVTALGLQGIANRNAEGPRVFLRNGQTGEDWLQFSLRLRPAETAQISPEELLQLLRPQLKGQVLYDPQQPWTLDLATTAAGVKDLAITATDLGLPTIHDFRTQFQTPDEAYAWAVKNLLPVCNRSAAALLPSGSRALRDFAVSQRLFTFSPPQDPAEGWFQSILKHLPPGTAVYGAASREGLLELSRASHFLVPAATTGNVSFLSQTDGEGLYQYRAYLEPIADRYLTLIFDDTGLDSAVNDMRGNWLASERGSLPLGWALPGMLAEAAPLAARRYYADAYWSGTDQFILGANGAGRMEFSEATAPFNFYRATREAARKLDLHSCLYDGTGANAGALPDEVARFLADTGLSGAYITGIVDMEPLVLGNAVMLAAPRVSSAEAAVTYLNRIPLDRRCAALVLDASALTPADAAHIAANVSDRYVVIPPEEMIPLVRQMSLPAISGTAAVGVASVDYTEQPTPFTPIQITAALAPAANVSSALAVYQTPGQVGYRAETMQLGEDGWYHGALPPLPQGGEVRIRVRARDQEGRTTWSPDWTVTIPRTDTDEDGLSDAEEQLLATDPKKPDTDGDGLLDANDPAPRDYDEYVVTYAGPILPPDDAPYLLQPGKSSLTAAGRELAPGDTCLYWLPLLPAPADTTAVVGIKGEGSAVIAMGTEPDALGAGVPIDLDGSWYSAPLPPGVFESGVYVRISSPAEASRALSLRSVAVVSPPGGPSIANLQHYPAFPGPEQAINISARPFSPVGLSQVRLGYRLNGIGAIIIPMTAIAKTQRYQARIPALENRDELEYWVLATDTQGRTVTTVPSPVSIGGRARETVAMLARRDFLGEWVSSDDWGGGGRVAAQPGAVDHAFVKLNGGTYTVWALAGGRGQGIGVYVKGAQVGSINPKQPDGWQRIGRVKLDSGRSEVKLVAESLPEAPEGSAPRYAAVVLTADTTFSPPAGRLFDVHNSLTLMSPTPNQVVSGLVELLGTAAGNITGVEVSLDGVPLRKGAGPPFRFSLNMSKIEPGEHTLQVAATDRNGPIGLSVEIPVTVAPTRPNSGD